MTSSRVSRSDRKWTGRGHNCTAPTFGIRTLLWVPMDCSGARLLFLKVGVQCRCGGCQASLERDLSTSTEMHRAPPTRPLDAPGGMGRKYPTDCRTIHQNKTHGVRVVLTPECLGAVQQQLSSPAAPLNDQAGDAEATMTPETPLHSANPKTHRMQCHHARLASGTSQPVRKSGDGRVAQRRRGS